MLIFKIETEGREYYFRAKTSSVAIRECEKKYKYFTLYLRVFTGKDDNIAIDYLVHKKTKPWWKWWG